MADFLLQEDGSSKFTLEDGSGFLLLEAIVTETPTPGGATAAGVAPSARVTTPQGDATAAGTAPGASVPVGRGAAYAGGHEPFETVAGATPKARVSQAAAEILLRPDPAGRVTQAAVEALLRPEPGARISQAAIEVLVRNQYDLVEVIWSDE